MPKNYNKGKGPYGNWPETVERDGIKLIKGKCEPLYEFDLREYHSRATGMPASPPEPPKAIIRGRR